MGNSQSQHKNPIKLKIKTKEQFKKLFLIKKENLFSKLSWKSSSIISCFLNIKEYKNLLQVSKSIFQIFNQSSSCFQIQYQKLLNIKCELIQSSNWKNNIIKSLPYGKKIKSQILRQCVQYLIDISTNKNNIHQYGSYNFQYCQELNQIIYLTIDLTPKLNIEYQQDEELLIYIFGQYVYEYYIFQLSSSFRIEQFKTEIKKFHQEANKYVKFQLKILMIMIIKTVFQMMMFKTLDIIRTQNDKIFQQKQDLQFNKLLLWMKEMESLLQSIQYQKVWEHQKFHQHLLIAVQQI